MEPMGLTGSRNVVVVHVPQGAAKKGNKEFPPQLQQIMT
jgi:hypothetical protein